MSLFIAARCCQSCHGTDDEEKQLNWKIKMSRQIDMQIFQSGAYCDSGYISEEQYNDVLVFVSNLSVVCFECERERPLVYQEIKKNYIEPLKKNLKESRKEYMKRNKKSKIPGKKNGNVYPLFSG